MSFIGLIWFALAGLALSVMDKGTSQDIAWAACLIVGNLWLIASHFKR